MSILTYSVYKGVARGIGDVGGGVQRTLENLNDTEAKDALTILYKTKAYPNHPFAIKASISAKTKVKISKALLAIPVDLLEDLSIQHLIKTEDSEYDSVRDIAKALSPNQE